MTKNEATITLPEMSEDAKAFIDLLGNINDPKTVEPITWIGLQNIKLIEALVAKKESESLEGVFEASILWKLATKLEHREDKQWGGSYPNLLLWTFKSAILENLVPVSSWRVILANSYLDGFFELLEPYEQFELLNHHHVWHDLDDLPERFEVLKKEFGDDVLLETAA